MSPPTATIAALTPVRDHLLRSAADQAARIRADARREAAEIAGQARREAEAIMAEARVAGQLEADRRAAAELRRAHDDARSALLSAQRAATDELRSRVRAAVGALPAEPGYDELARRLTRLAGLAAGPGAALTPDRLGGVVARAAGVVVDCSLPRLADLAVDALGARVRELWTP
jgi:vacuolar-type H+-ATPase subunit E/Vma4